jgi:hypothetical protein
MNKIEVKCNHSSMGELLSSAYNFNVNMNGATILIAQTMVSDDSDASFNILAQMVTAISPNAVKLTRLRREQFNMGQPQPLEREPDGDQRLAGQLCLQRARAAGEGRALPAVDRSGGQPQRR